MFHILYGADDYSLHQTLVRMKQGLGDEESLASNTTVFAASVSSARLVDSCSTVPFLAANRLVIVEGLLSHFESPDRKQRVPSADLARWAKLKDYIPIMPQTTALVLTDGSLRRNNALLKELAPVAEVREFPLLRGPELYRWIGAKVEQEGSDISSEAVRLLADLIGGNLWLLSNEAEKLCLSARGRRVEESDVRALVGPAREANVFAMVDAVLESRLTQATKLLHQLLDEGAAPAYLLFMITRQFRLVLRGGELLSQGLPPGDLANNLGLSSDFLLRKTTKQASAHSPAKLREAYQRLLETDIAIKTGKVRGELALLLLVSELCRL
ncbi:DNA polymerase III subunit delta [Chloroflexota bacterium]